MEKRQININPLVELVDELTAPDGCPWDRVQTHESMRKHLIEEAYEVVDAIERADSDNLREELGDVLFQVVSHANLAEKAGQFTLQDVIDQERQKMIRRHPKIYGSSEEEKNLSWDDIKKREKKSGIGSERLPLSMPSIMKLDKLIKRCEKNMPSQELEALCTNELEVEALALIRHAQREGKNLDEILRLFSTRIEQTITKMTVE